MLGGTSSAVNAGPEAILGIAHARMTEHLGLLRIARLTVCKLFSRILHAPPGSHLTLIFQWFPSRNRLRTLPSPAPRMRATTPMTDPQSSPPPEVQTAWSGRFAEPVSDLVKRYTASVDFDQRMWRQDIRGSLAHARMLAKQGIIAAGDLIDIERGMKIVTREIESGEFEWSLDLEDVHLNIEKQIGRAHV